MRMRNVRLLLALAFGLLSARAALATDYSGKLGLRYDRLDTWAPNGVNTSSPQLQLDADLQAAGFLSSPEIFLWNAAGAYQRLRRSYLAETDTASSYTYRLHLGGFESRKSRFTIGGDAGHTTIDFSQETGGPSLTGTTTIDTYQLRVAASPTDRPAVWLGGTYTDLNNRGFGRSATDETTKQVDTGFAFGTGAYSTTAEYEGRWSQGTLDPANYERHTVRMNGSVNIAPDTKGYLSTFYQLREPTVVSGYDPRMEVTHVSGGVRWTEESTISGAQYVYDHQALSTPGTADRDRITQGLSSATERTWSSQWKTLGTLSVDMTQDRLGLAEERSAGQSAALQQQWTRPSTPDGSELQIAAGASLGVLEPVGGGGVESSYGASGSIRWGMHTLADRISAYYTAFYGSNVAAVRGWNLNQRVYAEAERTIDRDFRLRATIQGGASRQFTPLFGDTAQRDFTLTASVLRGKYSFGLEAGIGDGVTGSLQSIGGDGLFIPASFQSHSRYAMAMTGVQITARLRVDGRARYTTLSGPEVPDQREVTLGGALRYALGRFQLSLEDRYSAGGTTAYDNRSNQLLLVLSRALGGTF